MNRIDANATMATTAKIEKTTLVIVMEIISDNITDSKEKVKVMDLFLRAVYDSLACKSTIG